MGVTVAASQVWNGHSLYLSLNGAYIAVQWIHGGPLLEQEFEL